MDEGQDDDDEGDGEKPKGLEYVFLNHTALNTASHPLVLASGHTEWYPVLVDAVVQSMGTGFVGRLPQCTSPPLVIRSIWRT